MMSGPIVRKYGFPNFEKIFGARAPHHGIEDVEATPAKPTAARATPPAPEPAAPSAEQAAARAREEK